ncbi:DR2241 family protein [Natronosalvus vescus]|uniref:DR2241 family protein n=1 Tax=Natronosalvus vescus TaxID=2953881 RepID=UPI002090402B|nr:DR2241 family protein [Natronosalvus vescus]
MPGQRDGMRSELELTDAVGEAVLEAVRETDNATTAIDFDGLRIGQDEDGYVLETPETAHDGLTEADLAAALESAAPYVTNWHFWERTVGGEGTARRAFLRWAEGASFDTDGGASDDSSDPDSVLLERHDALESASGVVRHWGELELRTRLADAEIDQRGEPGGRVYEIRHVDDSAEPLDGLERYDDPREARDLVTYDDRGRYRPLKTAPSLVSGWCFDDLSSSEFVETIRAIYPATIANWHREQRGRLDVDHWIETAERQSGIYDVIDELPREALEWVTEACCVDSQCLKRRKWHFDEDDELSTPGGDGEFPCREPCSLVIAAARKWTILESENEKTWELELTTSEMNQLAEIVDAVADGRVDEIREADVYDGANRYRARYLRAKRLTDGSLDADQTDD